MDPRIDQARSELGRTEVSPRLARALVCFFVLTLGGVAVWDGAGGGVEDHPAARLAGRAGGWLDALGEDGPVASNRLLREDLHQLETALEEGSEWTDRVQPPAQWLLSVGLGAGNEEVHPGQDGWLFFRSDIGYLTAPGFLALRPGAPGDPLGALLDLKFQLEHRGIELLVLPVPGKPTLHPEGLVPGRRLAPETLRNPDFASFLRRLEVAGVHAFDPVAILAGERAGGRDPYLKTDTHWRPGAVERVAASLARRLEALMGLETPAISPYRHRRYGVRGRGDLSRLLRLPPGWPGGYPEEEVEIAQVITLGGQPWRVDRDSPVLLLGDSYTNVFSQEGLGWGRGGGLAEQLSFHLRRGIDRIAVNGGGASGAREELRRQLAADPERLAAKRLVLYQFSVRDLVFGDWPVLDLALGRSTAAR